MANALSPEVSAWLQTLELSIDIKNPKRDLANGCVVAEILARYFPGEVSLHSFENVSSLPLKDANWHLLLKLFRRVGLAIGEETTNKVMLCEDGAAAALMQQIWQHLNRCAEGGPGAMVDAADTMIQQEAAVYSEAHGMQFAPQQGAATCSTAQPSHQADPGWQGHYGQEDFYGHFGSDQTWDAGAHAAASASWLDASGGGAAAASDSGSVSWQPQSRSLSEWHQMTAVSSAATAPQTQQLSNDAAAFQPDGGDVATAASWQQYQQPAAQWLQPIPAAEMIANTMATQWQWNDQSDQQQAAYIRQQALPWQQQQQQPPAQAQYAQPAEFVPRQASPSSQRRAHSSASAAQRPAPGAAAANGAQYATAAQLQQWQIAAQYAPQHPFELQAAMGQQQAWQQQAWQQQALAQQQAQAHQQQLVPTQQQAKQPYWLPSADLGWPVQQQQQHQQQKQMQALQRQQSQPLQRQQSQQAKAGKRLPSSGKAQQVKQQQQQGPVYSVQDALHPTAAFQAPGPTAQFTQQSGAPTVDPASSPSAAGVETTDGCAAALPNLELLEGAQQPAALGRPAALSKVAHTNSNGNYSNGNSNSSGSDSTGGHSRMPTLAFDRRPRPVDFRPFTQQDPAPEFQDRNFDAKKAPKYWELGLLGPVPDAQLAAKLESRDRVREFGRRMAKQNHEKLAAQAAARPPQSAPATRRASARDLALQFSKSVQRPASHSSQLPSDSRLTQSAAVRLGMINVERLGTGAERQRDELARMQMQHEVDRTDVAAIAQGLRCSSAGAAKA